MKNLDLLRKSYNLKVKMVQADREESKCCDDVQTLNNETETIEDIFF